MNKFLTSLLLVVMVFAQLAFPLHHIQVYANESIESKHYTLYEVIETTELSDQLTVEEGTFLYGKEKQEYVEIQYKDTYLEVPYENFQEVTENEQVPEFLEILADEAVGLKILDEGTVLVPESTDFTGEITITEEVAYHYNEDENGKKLFYLGNTIFQVKGETEQESGTEDDEEATDLSDDMPEEEVEEESTIGEGTTDVDEDNLVEEEINEDEATEEQLEEEVIQEDEEASNDQGDISISATLSNAWDGSNAKYFKVNTEYLLVYTKGNTRVIGELVNGQEYPIEANYGNWHKIQYGGTSGFVYKASTVPSNGDSLRNENKSYKQSSQVVVTKSETAIFDNTSGSLVQFGTLSEGEEYPIVSDYGNWWRIIFVDRVGYISKSNVSTPLTGDEEYFQVTTENLPIYDNRTGSLVKVGSLTEGQTYEIVSHYGNWYRINFDDYYGYVHKSDTKPSIRSNIKNDKGNFKNSERSFIARENVRVFDNTSGSLIQFGTIEKGVSYQIVSDYGNWWRVIFAERIGYVSKNSVRTGFLSGDDYFVAKDNLSIFDNRSGSLKQVGTVKKGQAYEIVSDYGSWHRIQFNNHYGYVYKADTEPTNGNRIPNKNISYKHTDRSFTALEDTIVYDNTGGTLKPFGTILEGQAYYIVSDYGNWWRVIFADRVGYVSKSQVSYNFFDTDSYFKVTTNNLPIFENSTGEWVEVGSLKKGQVYPRVGSYGGSWHSIKFNKSFGYVQMDGTEIGNPDLVKNLNTDYKHTNDKIIVNEAVEVFDNSSGELVPFATLNPDVIYPIASDYGNWWRIIVADRVGYVSKSSVSNYGIKETEYNLTLEQALSMQMNNRPQTDKEYDSYVSKVYIDENNRVKADTLNVRGGPGTSFWVIGQLKKGTAVEIVDEVNGWYQIRYTEKHQWVNPSPADVRYYLNPLNFVNNERQKFQFLDLARSSDASASALNRYLNGKGILSNQGQAFLDASNKHGVNDIYLVSHASLETGHGTSQLANGVEVGKNKQGNLVLVTNANRSSLVDIRTTYNMYGIGAVDNNALRGGAFRAYNEGWFTPREAIIGGAGFIGNDYIKAGQNTLYKMRWNPAAMDLRGAARHQYATDIGWAAKQVNVMYNLYQQLDSYTLYLDIPVYK